MATKREQVFYVRGLPPPGFEPGVSDGLVRDAKILLALQRSQIDAIRNDLKTYAGFLDRAALEDRLQTHLDDQESCKGLARFITAIDERSRVFDVEVQNLILQIERWLSDEENQKKSLISDEEFQELRQRLPLIIQPYPALERQAKAEYLAEATGQPLERLELICDLRPVFDKARENVEGMVPLTILKVVCTGVDGLPLSLEVVLSEKDVHDLAKASSDAQKKLKKLRELISSTDIAIPPIELTRQPDEHAKN